MKGVQGAAGLSVYTPLQEARGGVEVPEPPASCQPHLPRDPLQPPSGRTEELSPAERQRKKPELCDNNPRAPSPTQVPCSRGRARAGRPGVHPSTPSCAPPVGARAQTDGSVGSAPQRPGPTLRSKQGNKRTRRLPEWAGTHLAQLTTPQRAKALGGGGKRGSLGRTEPHSRDRSFKGPSQVVTEIWARATARRPVGCLPVSPPATPRPCQHRDRTRALRAPASNAGRAKAGALPQAWAEVGPEDEAPPPGKGRARRSDFHPTFQNPGKGPGACYAALGCKQASKVQTGGCT